MSSEKDKIHAHLIAHLPTLLEALFGNRPRIIGETYRYDNFSGATDGDSPSLAIWESGNWKEFNPSPKESIPRLSGDIFDLISAKQGHTSFAQTLDWARNFLGYPKLEKRKRPSASKSPEASTFRDKGVASPPTSPTPRGKPLELQAPKLKDGRPLAHASPATLEKAVRALWSRGEAALTYLRNSRGLSDNTIRHFHIGLTSFAPRRGSGKKGWENALYYPLLHADGRPYARFRMARVPGFTTGAAPAPEWGAGSPDTYWATPLAGRTDVLVVEGHRDAWKVWQEIQGTPVQETLAIITSSHGSGIPGEWKSPDFWSRWNRVYAGQDNDDAGDRMAEAVRRYAHREVHRIRPPGDEGADWTDAFQAGLAVEGFLERLKEAAIMSEQVPEALPTSVTAQNLPSGTYSVKPVDINGAWANGHLYYPYRVLVVERSDEGRQLARFRTEVLRSDGRAFTYDYLPSPPGTPAADRVLALNDGTVIRRAPTVVEGRQTWSHASILEYQRALREGRDPTTIPVSQVLERMVSYLRSKVILPREEDYALLAFIAAASYCQRMFDAVPLVLVTGVAGSGKSEVGRAMSQISANGITITGQTSAATAAREIDRTAGLVVFDDLESIGRHSSGPRGGDFSDLVQQLKVSYKSSTSTKSLTIMTPNGARTETLDFFGIKLVTNTTGADSILGSRMMIIRTKRVDAQQVTQQLDNSTDKDLELSELRDAMHTWVMHNATRIHDHYRANYASASNRHDEISAPLRTLADLVGHEELALQLQVSLSLQAGRQEEVESYEDLLREALRQLIRRGYTHEVSLAQLELEMTALVGPAWGVENTTEIPKYRQPRWIGEALRNNWWADNGVTTDKRRRLWGAQTRIYKLADGFVQEVLKELSDAGVEAPTRVGDPLAFCLEATCSQCSYREYCSFQIGRQQRTGERLN